MAVQNIVIRYDVEDEELSKTLKVIQEIDKELLQTDKDAKRITFKPVAGSIDFARQKVSLLETAIRAAGTASDRLKLSKELKAAHVELDKLNAELKQTPKHIQSSGGSLGFMQAGLSRIIPMVAAAFSVQKIAEFGMTMLKSAGQIESTRFALETMVGSTRKANGIIQEAIEISNKSPFEFPEVANTIKQLISFGVSSNNAVNLTSRLGDIAAGTGANLQDLAFVLGQVKATQTAYTQDINQFAARGVPIYEELAKVLKISTSEVKKAASEGKIGFAEIEQAIVNTTSEGGKFFGMMEKQSQTFEGKLSTFTDAWNGLVRVLGEQLLPIAKEALTWLTDLISVNEKQSEALREEQTELNVLATGYMNALKVQNESAESKKNLQYWQNELNKEYPEFLASLGEEATSLEAVRGHLEAVNKEYEKKIKFAAGEEFIAEQGKGVADAFKKQMEAQRVAIEALRELEKQGKVTIDKTKPLAAQVQQVFDQFSRAKDLDMTIDQATSSIGKLGDGWSDLGYIFAGPILGASAEVAESLLSADTPLEKLRLAATMYAAGTREAADAQSQLEIATESLNNQLALEGLTREQASASLKGQADGLEVGTEATHKATKASKEHKSALEKQSEKMNDMIDEARRLSESDESVDIMFAPTWDEKKAKEVEDQAKRLLAATSGDEELAVDQKRLDIIQSIISLEEDDAAKKQDRIDRLTKMIRIAQEALSVVQDFYGAIANYIETVKTQEEEAEIERIENEKERYINAAKDKEKARIQAEKNFDSQIKKIEIEQAKRRKKIALAEAIIQQSLNVLKALGTPPVPNFLLAGIALALGAIQVATIAKTGFAKGGYTGDGAKHDEAGIVHKGEFVMPKDITMMNRDWFEWIHKNKINLGEVLAGKMMMGHVPASNRGVERRLDELIYLGKRKSRIDHRINTDGFSSRWGYSGGRA